MAFLPLEDDVDALKLLSDDEAMPAELISYFEGTYIGIQRGRGERRRVEPLSQLKCGKYESVLWMTNLELIMQ